ncbi:MAG: hypothetical protein GF370_01045 [Candidatus Nealsonbacteria bacterium]|nr:hypothetical protein [Candidatus Nealsonbacteria bacterium]
MEENIIEEFLDELGKNVNKRIEKIESALKELKDHILYTRGGFRIRCSEAFIRIALKYKEYLPVWLVRSGLGNELELVYYLGEPKCNWGGPELLLREENKSLYEIPSCYSDMVPTRISPYPGDCLHKGQAAYLLNILRDRVIKELKDEVKAPEGFYIFKYSTTSGKEESEKIIIIEETGFNRALEEFKCKILSTEGEKVWNVRVFEKDRGWITLLGSDKMEKSEFFKTALSQV